MKIIFNRYYSLFTGLVKINEIVSDSGKFKYLRYFKRNNSLLFGGFPGDSVVKNLPANAGGSGLIPGWGRPPGEGNGYLFQYSCLENPMDRGAWQATVHGVAKESDTT